MYVYSLIHICSDHLILNMIIGILQVNHERILMYTKRNREHLLFVFAQKRINFNKLKFFYQLNHRAPNWLQQRALSVIFLVTIGCTNIGFQMI